MVQSRVADDLQHADEADEAVELVLAVGSRAETVIQFGGQHVVGLGIERMEVRAKGGGNRAAIGLAAFAARKPRSSWRMALAG